MSDAIDLENRLRNAWLGRVSGCMLGKPVELQLTDLVQRTLSICQPAA